MQSEESEHGGTAEVPAVAGVVAVQTDRISGLLATHPVRLNIGAGNKRPPGWISIDADGAADVTCDFTSIPLPDGCADEAMAIHVIEHVHRWEAPAVLREWMRLLVPGGRLILELPDFKKCCIAVANGAPHQMGKQGIYGDHSSSNPLMMHKWGWTPDELSQVLREVGFIKIRECDPQFHGKRKHRDMRLEAIKPC